MTFMDEVIHNSLTLWKEAANVEFLEEMGKGILDRHQFYEYIIQDSLYLRDYVKAFAMGIYKSKTLKEMQIFYSVLGFVKDSENKTRLEYLADYGMVDEDIETIDKKLACKDYTDFLIDTAFQEEIPEILMAIMPCMLGYYYVFTELLKKYPTVVDTYYGPLVKDYTSKQYLDFCNYWKEYCNQVCEQLDSSRKIKLNNIFKEASKHELYFWEMAGKKNEK